MEIRDPTSAFTGEQLRFTRDMVSVIRSTPQFSYFTQSDPNGVLFGTTGDLAIYRGPTSTLSRYWAKASEPDVVSNQSWVQLGAGGSGGTGIQSVVAGSGITVDNTDPANPIVASTVLALQNDGTPLAGGPFHTINGIGGGFANSGSNVAAYTPPGGSGVAILKQFTVVFDNDEIKALPSAYDTELLAAPGSGLMYVLHSAAMICDATAGGYTNIDADGSFMGVDIEGSGGYLTQMQNTSSPANTALTDFLTDPVGFPMLYMCQPPMPDTALGVPDGGTTFHPPFAINNYENLAISLTVNNSGDFTGGNAANTLRVTVIYSTLNLSTGLYV